MMLSPDQMRAVDEMNEIAAPMNMPTYTTLLCAVEFINKHVLDNLTSAGIGHATALSRIRAEVATTGVFKIHIE